MSEEQTNAHLKHYQKRIYQVSPDESMPYRLLLPPEYDPTKIYPLVVWLHGISGRGSDNEEQIIAPNDVGPAALASATLQAEHPCIVLAPQCPTLSMWFNPLNRGSTSSLRIVPHIIQTICSNFSVDRNRIYLIGQSMGAFGSWALLPRHPELFAAAIVMSGGGRTRHAKALAKIPLWVFHGQHDLTVFVYFSRRMVQAIREVGGTPRYTEYEGAPHYIWDRVFAEAEIFDWLFSHQKDKP